MKVKELKEFLKNVDDDIPIIIACGTCNIDQTEILSLNVYDPDTKEVYLYVETGDDA